MKQLLRVLTLLVLVSCQKPTSNDYVLHYDKPATNWMSEALPLGNGYIGAMYFGGVEKEQIQFSEGTLWSGGPKSNPDYNYGIRKGAYKHLKKARALMKQGKYQKADALVKKEFTGILDNKSDDYVGMFKDYGAQQTMGDLFITPKHPSSSYTHYKRELNVSKSLAKVEYEIEGNKYTRTYFANYPSNTMVYRFSSEVPTDYTIEFKTPHVLNSTHISEKAITFNAEVKDNGMKFQTVIDLSLSDGEITPSGDKLLIMGAKNLVVKHVAATEFKLEFPNYDGNDFVAQNQANLAKGKSYNALLKEHIADYQSLFNRFEIKLGEPNKKRATTDVELEEYAQGATNNYLEELFMQYNRYLMISGSRPNSMSMHLQGKWNKDTDPVWAADYHSNINLQMIYWPAELTNLSECHIPYLEYTQSLVEPGKLAAKQFFNTRGWMVNTMCNAFGYTSIGWGIPWGFFPSGAAWMSQHMFHHYEFNNDLKYLKNIAYPVMKEAALFWIDYLVKDETGKYVSMPSYSPEHGTISAGASMDQQIVWDLFNNIEKAAKALKIEDEFTAKVSELKQNLLAPQIGKWGQLMEWKEDLDDPNNHHRHVSHLFAVHPGSQISPSKTPELAKAAAVSLNARGDGGTGWSKAWKINFWARLKDGEHAHKMLREAFSLAKTTQKMEGGGIYHNMFMAHPPFQLDGNMGTTSGMVEMLVQSQADEIELLPALPKVWNSGSVKGIKARGGFTVSMDWESGKPTNVVIHSVQKIKYKVRFGSSVQEVNFIEGENKITI